MFNFEEQKRQHDFRQKLLYRVSKGDISPNDATELSIAQGAGELLNRADRSKHDPMSSASWSITMTLAWIMYRDMEKVLLFSEGYRSEEEKWCSVNYISQYDEDQNFTPDNPIHHKGYEPRCLDELADFTALLLESYVDLDEPELHQGEILFYVVNAAFEDVRESALNAELSVSATPIGGGAPVVIEAMDWGYFSIGACQKGMAVLYQDIITRVYEGIRFRRIDVLRLWPAFDPKSAPFPEEKVTLINAVLCIARRIARNGDMLTNQQIVNSGLFSPCAQLLFRILEKGEIATATGCRIENLKREPIIEEWKFAFEGEFHQNGHLIQWTDEHAFDGSGLAGTLTPAGESAPRWADIQVVFSPPHPVKTLTAKKQKPGPGDNPLLIAATPHFHSVFDKQGFPSKDGTSGYLMRTFSKDLKFWCKRNKSLNNNEEPSKSALYRYKKQILETYLKR
ncbi:hypothetical protein [uncultured Roseibium sp.]|uniref:hypothetical protein n=1 Tax=uncultured Roseibium sp. TaxID=1936171 RepID=UPI00261A0A7F|nr:hypothetical protein [uncultured Roseibium sp.]